MLFYDVSTLYFETGVQDVLRAPGFSKDGKTAEFALLFASFIFFNRMHRGTGPLCIRRGAGGLRSGDVGERWHEGGREEN